MLICTSILHTKLDNNYRSCDNCTIVGIAASHSHQINSYISLELVFQYWVDCWLIVMKIKRVHSLVKVILYMKFEVAKKMVVKLLVGNVKSTDRPTSWPILWKNAVYFMNNGQFRYTCKREKNQTYNIKFHIYLLNLRYLHI